MVQKILTPVKTQSLKNLFLVFLMSWMNPENIKYISRIKWFAPRNPRNSRRYCGLVELSDDYDKYRHIGSRYIKIQATRP